MASDDIFDFIDDVYTLLPESDRLRFGELWTAYEQTYGDVWTRLLQSQLASVISTVPVYNIQRWLQHEFDSTTQVNLTASYTTTTDLAENIFTITGTLQAGNSTITTADTSDLPLGAPVSGSGIAAGTTITSIVTPTSFTVGPSLPSASVTETLIITGGIDVSTNYLLKFSVDEGEPVEVNLTGNLPADTTGEEIVSVINTAAGFTFATLIDQSTAIVFQSTTSGPTSSLTFYPTSNPSANASLAVLGIDPAELPASFPEFPYSYKLVDSSIASIPTLQDMIRSESVTVTLTENTDFLIVPGSGIISFKVQPISFMWAPDTLYDFQTAYNNFGYLLNFYEPTSADYVKAVKGLWYAFWTGPSPQNIQRSLFLLFGLPTASQAGSVTAITGTQITLTYTDNTTEIFPIPSGLFSVVYLGQVVEEFQPLVNGITVLDHVNSPGFVTNLIGRPGIQTFLTQFATRGASPTTDESKALLTIEQNTYLPQIEVNAFINPDVNLANVKTFLTNMQPKSRTFLSQILVGDFQDTITPGEELYDSFGINADETIDGNSNTWAQATDLTDAETDPLTGIAIDSNSIAMTDYVYMAVTSTITSGTYPATGAEDSFLSQGHSGGTTQLAGANFTTSGALTSVPITAVIPLSGNDDGSLTGNMTLNIYSNSGGSPGSLLYTATNVVLCTSIGGSSTNITFTFTGITLSASTEYWLVLVGDSTFINGTNDGSDVLWYGSSGTTNAKKTTNNGSSWTSLGGILLAYQLTYTTNTLLLQG